MAKEISRIYSEIRDSEPLGPDPIFLDQDTDRIPITWMRIRNPTIKS